jgi:hypothetical protein
MPAHTCARLSGAAIRPRGAVVELTGEHDADHGWPVRDRGRAEQRIDGRARQVLLRPVRQHHAAFVQQHVPIRPRHGDAPGLDQLRRLRMNRPACPPG